MPLRAVLCDLDDTLFDHYEASRTAIAALHASVPGFACWSVEELATRHSVLLELLHVEVLQGRLTIPEARTERFRRLLVDAAAARPAERAPELAGTYRRAYETSCRAVPGALDLLGALKQARIPVAVVTNNIVVEQQMKLVRCGLSAYVDALVTSEEVGVQKPGVRIFEVALERLNAPADNAVMLGDGWATDVLGARAAGVRAVWFNRHGAANLDPDVPELRSLVPTSDVLRALDIARPATTRIGAERR
jgi:putative hydrolase of the HAD superfamily